MFGFVVAAFSLAGLVALSVQRRRYGHFGRRGLYRLLARLDTSPGQEKVIRSALDDVRDQGKAVFDRERSARPELAALFANPTFDDAAVEAWFERRFAALQEFKKTTFQSIKVIHDVLDDRQRKEVARLLERGPLFLGGFRHHHGCHHHHSCHH